MAGSFVNQMTTGNKSTVVWLSVGMSGGSMSLDCFSGFLYLITTGKKVQLSGYQLQCRIVLTGLLLCFFGGFLDQITNFNKKKVQLPGYWLECLLCTFGLLHPSR